MKMYAKTKELGPIGGGVHPVYQEFYNRCEIIPGVYFHVPHDMPNYTGGIFSRTIRHAKLYPPGVLQFKV